MLPPQAMIPLKNQLSWCRVPEWNAGLPCSLQTALACGPTAGIPFPMHWWRGCLTACCIISTVIGLLYLTGRCSNGGYTTFYARMRVNRFLPNLPATWEHPRPPSERTSLLNRLQTCLTSTWCTGQRCYLTGKMMQARPCPKTSGSLPCGACFPQPGRVCTGPG